MSHAVLPSRVRARGWLHAAAALILAHTTWQVWSVAAAPYPARYDYDEGVYAATAAAAAGGARLYTETVLSQPPLVITVLTGAFRAFGTSLPVARDTVVLFSALWLAALAAIPASLRRPRAGVLALCFALGSPLFLTAAHTVQMEGPSEALAAAAVAAAVFGARGERTLWWAAAGTLAGLAVMAKLSAATCVVPLLAAAVMLPSRRPGPGSRYAALTAGAVAAALPFLLSLATGAALDQTLRFHLALAGRAPEPLGLDLSPRAAAVRDFVVAGWPLVAGGVSGIALGAADRTSHLAAGWLAACGIVLSVLNPLWPHHFAILLSPLALLAGSAADRAIAGMAAAARGGTHAGPVGRRAQAAAWTVFLGAAILGAAYLGTGAGAAAAGRSSGDLRRMSANVAAGVAPGGAVLTDDPMVPFLARRAVPPAFIDTSYARFAARRLRPSMLNEALTDPKVRGVLFWRGTFRRLAPRLEARAAAAFPVRIEAGGGRVLYLKAR